MMNENYSQTCQTLSQSQRFNRSITWFEMLTQYMGVISRVQETLLLDLNESVDSLLTSSAAEVSSEFYRFQSTLSHERIATLIPEFFPGPRTRVMLPGVMRNLHTDFLDNFQKLCMKISHDPGSHDPDHGPQENSRINMLQFFRD